MSEITPANANPTPPFSPSSPPTPSLLQRLGRLGRLTQKELREVLRDRRTILTLVLMPLLLYPLLTIAFQQFFLSALAPKPPVRYRLGVNSEAEGNWLIAYLSLATPTTPATKTPFPPLEVLLPDDKTNMTPALRGGQIDLLVRVPQAAHEGNQITDQITDGDLQKTLTVEYLESSLLAQEALQMLRSQLAEANARFLSDRLRQLGITQPAVPVDLKTVVLPETVTPKLPISLTTMLPLVLILMTITGAVYPAIDLTAGERERGTLEILVAAPVPRLGLLLAKYVAVLTVSLLTASVNMVSMVATVLVSGLGQALLGSQSLTGWTVLQVFGLLVVFSSFFSAVLLALTSFARSFKEAQAYLIPLMLAALTPGVLSLTPGLKLTGALAVVPLLNIVLLARDLLEGNATLPAAVVVITATALYSLAAVGLAARLFGAEAVLYGSAASWSDMWIRPAQSVTAVPVATALLCLAVLFPTYFLGSGLVQQFSGDITTKLLLAACTQAAVFILLPLWFARRAHLRLRTWLRGPTMPLVAFAAALLLGVGLWPIAHEIVLFTRQWGLAGLSDEQLQRAAKLAAAFQQTVPLAILLLVVAVLPALSEELFFRGFLLPSFADRNNPAWGVVISALLFGVFHVITPTAFAVERFFPSLLLGLVLGTVYVRAGSLFPGMLLHLLHNGLLIGLVKFKPQLEAHGWGVVETDHLPPSWLLVALLLSGGGLGLLALLAPRKDEG